MIPCRLVAVFDDGDLCAERAGYRHCIYLFLLGKTYGAVKNSQTGLWYLMLFMEIPTYRRTNIQEEYGMSRTYKLTMNKV